MQVIGYYLWFIFIFLTSKLRFLSLHSENVALKSEHSQSVEQLTMQTETLRSNFREQLHHLQKEHRSTVETLQHEINRLETQLFQLQKEPATSGKSTTSFLSKFELHIGQISQKCFIFFIRTETSVH